MVESQNFEVCDHAGDSQIIGTVLASVPDGQDLAYRLTEDSGGLFEIDEEGRISLVSGKDLSFTNTNRHVITVEVSNTASSDTSTADVTIDVDTVPLVANTNHVFTYGDDVSVMLNNLGQPMESFTHSSNFPVGLDFANQNGQLSIQGSPRAVTLDESNQQISSVPIDAVLHNSCGSNSFRAMIAVHPVYVSGNLSSNIVAESNEAASNHNNDYLDQIYTVTNTSFASGGTGTEADPVLIGVADGTEDLNFVVDMQGNHSTFFFRFLNLPTGGRISLLGAEIMAFSPPNRLINVWSDGFLSRNDRITRASTHVGVVDGSTIVDVSSSTIGNPFLLRIEHGPIDGSRIGLDFDRVLIRFSFIGITPP